MSIGGNLYQQKWQKFLSRIWPFKFIPFVDFVLAAGSLATGRPVGRASLTAGNMHENSDFDVIVGVRQGRIFTARAFCILTFGFLGWRAKHSLKSQQLVNFQYFTLLKVKHPVRDKVCFNHFVAPVAYRLSPPHNEYWKNLYRSLVPVYGDPDQIQKFFDANADWANFKGMNFRTSDVQKLSANGGSAFGGKSQYSGHRKSIWLAQLAEFLLFGRFGNWLEKILKEVQIVRIENNLKNQSGYKPRIIYNDNELEFHPDTKRIEEWIQRR